MKVLLVDDEQLQLTRLKEVCEHVFPLGTELYDFTNPLLAVEKAEKEKIDIAFLDVAMPHLNGIHLAKKLKTLNPEINIIFVTAFDDYALDAYHMHVSGYVMKPVTEEKIREELGITQIQAANACGVSRRTYQTYEETNTLNVTYHELVRKLDEMGIFDGSNFITNVKYIKYVCRHLFAEKYPEIQSAYLFGSYARGDATGKSDVDILIVCPPMGMKFYGIATELEEQIHKQIDLHTHRQLMKSERLLERVLKEGIKIYG